MACKHLAAVALVLAARSPADAGSCVPGFDRAAGATDSFDSTLGYDVSHVATTATATTATKLALPPVAIPLVVDRVFGDVKLARGENLSLTAGTYVFSTLTLEDGATLTVKSAPVEIYVRCPAGGTGIAIAGRNAIVNASFKATDLVVFAGRSCADLQVTGGALAAYAVYAPQSAVTLAGGSTLYGTIVARSVDNRDHTAIHYDRALATYAGGGFACSGAEVSRAAPVVATLPGGDAIVQGTFIEPSGTPAALTTHGSVARWTFPFITGHVRAREAATSSILFDARNLTPPPSYAGCSLPAHGACRYVFTNTATGFRPAKVVLSDATSASIGALIAPALAAADDQTIVRTILGGVLGGVDRSTVAVIQASNHAGENTRPTIAYFGGTDGMLHAVCAASGGTTATQANVCPSAGTELWAFLPRVELPLVRTGVQRLDGSPHVIDAFGDFSSLPGLGGRAWRTILTFQTGYSVPGVTTGAAYALDVTDPASPVLLWEYAAPSAPASLDFGTGLVSALGPVLTPRGLVNEAVLETNNGGTGGAGVVTTAIQLETGAKLWQFGVLYPGAARVPATGLPGGAVGVDLAGTGTLTDVVFGDLYGELWRVSAIDGTNATGAAPLFAFAFDAARDRHPIGSLPAIYSDGKRQYVAFASGGYADAFDTSWSHGTQYLAAVKLAGTGEVRLMQPLYAGDNGYAQPLIVGTQLFVTSDATDVNAPTYGTDGTPTGHVLALSGLGATPTATTSTVYSGAGSLAAEGTSLVATQDVRNAWRMP